MNHSAAENASTAAAEQIEEPAQQQIGAGTAPHGEAAVAAGLAAVSRAAAFDLLQGVQIFLCTMGQNARTEAFKLIGKLRKAGISADMDHAARSMKAQFKYADKIGAQYTLSIGENELEAKKANLRNMQDGSQTEVSLEDISGWMNQ